MRSAIGLIAGPESPAVKFEIRGRLVSGSIARATNVLISEIASAPAPSATLAIWGTLVTFGESFTMIGRLETAFAAPTTSSRRMGSLPKLIPPLRVLGQET